MAKQIENMRAIVYEIAETLAKTQTGDHAILAFAPEIFLANHLSDILFEFGVLQIEALEARVNFLLNHVDQESINEGHLLNEKVAKLKKQLLTNE